METVWVLGASTSGSEASYRLLKVRLEPMEASRGYWELEGSKCEFIDDV